MAQFDAQARYRSTYDFRFDESEVDWDRPQRQVAAAVSRLGLPELDLLPAFRARADADQLYLREDTHFSVLGHQVVAGALAEFLRNGGWLSEHRAPRAS
jgi:lysophospholipase L1-like esterase